MLVLIIRTDQIPRPSRRPKHILELQKRGTQSLKDLRPGGHSNQRVRLVIHLKATSDSIHRDIPQCLAFKAVSIYPAQRRGTNRIEPLP